MANFYTDTPQFRHYLNHPLMKRIVELKERNYADKYTYDYAPMDFEDAIDEITAGVADVNAGVLVVKDDIYD